MLSANPARKECADAARDACLGQPQWPTEMRSGRKDETEQRPGRDAPPILEHPKVTGCEKRCELREQDRGLNAEPSDRVAKARREK